MINSKRNRDLLGLVLIMSAMGLQHEERDTDITEQKEKRVVIPPGAKYYHFRGDGIFEVLDQAPYWAVFSCIARTDRAAIKKFQNQL